jgi:hypothetical protein
MAALARRRHKLASWRRKPGARCAHLCLSMFACVKYAAMMLNHACRWVVVHRSIKLKEQFVAMVSHEARVQQRAPLQQRAPSFFAF